MREFAVASRDQTALHHYDVRSCPIGLNHRLDARPCPGITHRRILVRVW